MKAISFRPQWAWLIIHGHKDIEYRSRRTHHRGPFLVHATARCTREEYDHAQRYAAERGVDLPPMEDLPKGGIVGQASITDCVTEDPSPWFEGEYGWLLKNPKLHPFYPYKGKQGWFKVTGYSL